MSLPSRILGVRTNKHVIGDHVDILGRSSLNDLILRVAGGKGDLIEDNFVSDIRKYSERVKIYEEEEFDRSSNSLDGLVQLLEEQLGVNNQSKTTSKAT